MDVESYTLTVDERKSLHWLKRWKTYLSTCVLLSQCGIGQYRCVKSSVFSMDDVPRHDKFSCATAICCLVTSDVSLDYQFPVDITEVVP